LVALEKGKEHGIDGNRDYPDIRRFEDDEMCEVKEYTLSN
jgi:hypothetical protein